MSISRAGLKSKSSIVNYHWIMLCEMFETEISMRNYIEKPYTFKEQKEKFMNTCWACEFGPVTTYRCHIKALCEGGSNDSSNIHLLCDICHKESEYMSGEMYNEWFRTKRDLPSLFFDSLMQRAVQTEEYYLSGKWHLIPTRVLELIQENAIVQSYIKDNGIIIQKPTESQA